MIVGENGNILKIGNTSDNRQWATTHRVELYEEEHMSITSNFTDGHTHPALWGIFGGIGAGSVRTARSGQDLLRMVKEQAAAGDQSIPLLVLDHNNALIPGITGTDLDSVTNRPLAVMNVSYHSCIATSSMVTLIQQKATEKIRAGHFVTGSVASGELTEGYATLAINICEECYGLEALVAGIAQTVNDWLSHGIADMHEMCLLTWTELLAILTFRQQWRRTRKDDFPVRLFGICANLLAELLKRWPELEKMGLFSPEDWGKIVLKLIGDGSIGSYTSLFLQPYIGMNSCGIICDNDLIIDSALNLAVENGITKVAMHAIGDAAVLRAIETAIKWRRLAESRGLDPSFFRIEHCEASANMIPLLKAARVSVSSEPAFLLDYYMYGERLGDRKKALCPHASFLRNDILNIAGSDCMPPNPFFGLKCAIMHPVMEEQVSLANALAAYTVAPCRYEGSSRDKIQEGQPANLTILSEGWVKQVMSGEDLSNFVADEAQGREIAALKGCLRKIFRNGQLVYSN